jgi:hypothetical protein
MHLIRYRDRGTTRLGAVSEDIVVDVALACARAGIEAPEDSLSAAADPACAGAIERAERERSEAIIDTAERDLEPRKGFGPCCFARARVPPGCACVCSQPRRASPA